MLRISRSKICQSLDQEPMILLVIIKLPDLVLEQRGALTHQGKRLLDLEHIDLALELTKKVNFYSLK